LAAILRLSKVHSKEVEGCIKWRQEREKGRNVKHNDDDYNPVQLRPVARA